MQFGYTIIYVPEVEGSLRFFEQAFGFKRRFLLASWKPAALPWPSPTMTWQK